MKYKFRRTLIFLIFLGGIAWWLIANPNSYEAKRIYAERQNLLDDIEQFKSYIATTKDCINDYIAEKDVLYRELEQGRK